MDSSLCSQAIVPSVETACDSAGAEPAGAVVVDGSLDASQISTSAEMPRRPVARAGVPSRSGGRSTSIRPVDREGLGCQPPGEPYSLTADRRARIPVVLRRRRPMRIQRAERSTTAVTRSSRATARHPLDTHHRSGVRLGFLGIRAGTSMSHILQPVSAGLLARRPTDAVS
jgi:hypothetical protein